MVLSVFGMSRNCPLNLCLTPTVDFRGHSSQVHLARFEVANCPLVDVVESSFGLFAIAASGAMAVLKFDSLTS